MRDDAVLRRALIAAAIMFVAVIVDGLTNGHNDPEYAGAERPR